MESRNLIFYLFISFLLQGIATVAANTTPSITSTEATVTLATTTAVTSTTPIPQLSIGENCTGNQQLCITGTTCENSTCNIILNGTCNSSNAGYCKSGTQCDGGFCKLSIGGNCTINPQLCITGTTCEKSTCNINLNGNCNSTNAGYCKSGTQCDGGSCKLSIGENCTGNTQLCITGTTCENNRCNINLNGTCNSTNAAYCKSETQCDGGSCRLVYSAICNSSTENLCFNGLKCSSSADIRRCLCPAQYFRFKDTCNSAEMLKASNLVQAGTSRETELNLSWTAPSVGDDKNNIRYRVVINSTSSDSYVPSIVISKLTPGTLYTVDVFTVATRDNTYSNETTENVNPLNNYFYTKPAAPGRLTSYIVPGPNATLTFASSIGNVHAYSVTLLSDNITVNTSTTTATFYGLTLGQYYTVKIVALIYYNSRTMYSNDTIDTFRVMANAPGPVSNLNVTHIESRLVTVTWTRPLQPNGHMSGYLLRIAFQPGSCVSGIAWLCEDCTNSTSTNNMIEIELTNCSTKSYRNTTKNDLDNVTFLFNTTASGLKPDVTYTVLVSSYNEVGPGASTSTTVTTNMERASNLKELSVTQGGIGQLLVHWTPGELTGPTNYTVTWDEERTLNSDIFVYNGSQVLVGYNSTSFTITNLLSYWKYRIIVYASTPVGNSTEASINYTLTKDSQPGPVQNYTINQLGNTAQLLYIVFSCPLERERNGKISEYGYNTSVVAGNSLAPTTTGSWTARSDCNYNETIQVTAQTNYSISVFAKTLNYSGILTTNYFYVQPKPPVLVPPSNGFVINNTKTISDTSATVQVCQCLLDNGNGEITMAGLVICKKNAIENCSPNLGIHNKSYYVHDIPTWKMFTNKMATRYRSTSDQFHTDLKNKARRRRSLFHRSKREEMTGYKSVKIGDETCDQFNESVYCNGRLPSSSELVVIVFSCTEGGCTESRDVTIIKTLAPPSDFPVGAVVGGIIGGLILIALVIIIILLLRRYRSKPVYERTITVDGSIKKQVRKSVKLSDFSLHLEQLHRDSNLRFQEEFEEVQENSPKTYTTAAATIDANKIKNRYVNILPFDHSRVKLMADDDDATSDFINANFIQGYSSPREYIATQGPMVSTVPDFWRMIWEQKSTIIVMLSDLTEKGKPKVDLYWPEEFNAPVQYGNVIVKLKTSSTLNKYTIRTIDISIENGKEHRHIVQFFLPGWEDYGANLSPDDLLDFVKSVRHEARTTHGPVVVHCSAGVGRTGTFIALDFLMQFVNENNLNAEVDIYNLVLNMRHMRPQMVQSEKQYIFIHDALKLVIDKKIQSMQETGEENIYQNTPNDNIYANQAFVNDENIYENTMNGKESTTSL